MTESLCAATTAPRASKPPATTSREGLSATAGVRIVRTIATLRAEVRGARAQSARVGLVPTMGALHEGHLSLIRAARKQCDLVVVSLFVNPTQFDEQADLLAYPRAEAGDAQLAAKAGANLLFVPSADEIYKPGFCSSVEVHGLTDRLEGAIRGSSHFKGVTTIVCKLLNIALPDIAYFGQKDAQQAAVIKRMVADLDMEVEIETMPTIREPDGLAMSSRNIRLSEDERQRALSLHAALLASQQLLDSGQQDCLALIEQARRTLASFSVEPEYVAIVDPQSFEELDLLTQSGLMLIAARVGQTRLIDNLLLISQPSANQPEATQAAKGAVIATCSA